MLHKKLYRFFEKTFYAGLGGLSIYIIIKAINNTMKLNLSNIQIPDLVFYIVFLVFSLIFAILLLWRVVFHSKLM